MPFSAGVYTLPAGNPVVTATTITSSWANTTLQDIGTALTTCVLKDGTQTITANIPMATFKFTGLGVGSALTDSANLAQLQNGFGSFLSAVAGTNTITATATPTPAYTVGQRFTFIPAVTNTGAATLNISSVGAGAVQLGGAALIGGELPAGSPVTVYVTAATPVFEIVATSVYMTSFTATLTGCTTSPTYTVYATKIGNVVTLNIPAWSGTSNATTKTFTGMPAALRPASAQRVLVPTQDNGGTMTVSVANINSTGVIDFFATPAGGAFTNSGAASSVASSVTYQAN